VLTVLAICFLIVVKLMLANDIQASKTINEEIGLEYSTLGYQYDLIGELVKKGIPFYIDIEGVVRIDRTYEKKVAEITDDIETRPHTILKDKKHASLLVLLLKKNNIKYMVRHAISNGDIHIIWEKEDDSNARTIINSIFLEAVKESYATGVLGKFDVKNENEQSGSVPE